MRAITVSPGVANSARLEDVPEPPPSDGAVLVRTLALGVCGTDREILSGVYGFAPPGEERLVLGHESLGEVEAAPPECGLTPRRSCGRHRAPARSGAVPGLRRRRMGHVPQRALHRARHQGAARLRRGALSHRAGIRRQGRAGPGHLGVLLEPASIVAKAWDHTERIGHRARAWQPKSLLVTGAGPIGLLAALMGVQRGLEVHVLDRDAGGPKPALARDLGGSYHSDAECLGRVSSPTCSWNAPARLP